MMNVTINTSAALHQDEIAKEKARQEQKEKARQVNEKVEKCKCSYQSPFKDCPHCGDMKQWRIEDEE